MNLLETIKETQCSCNSCRRMCHRPCFGTPDDIEKLIQEGFGDRLMLDHHCGLNKGAMIFVLCPALKGYEGKQSPFVPRSEKGCTFWHYGKCLLHKSGLKPTSGKLAYHDEAPNPDGLDGGSVGAHVAETWNSDKGRTLVEKWCKERNLPVEMISPNVGDYLHLMAQELTGLLGRLNKNGMD